ncbi:DUF4270 domain-containing protein [Seonamhaeicola sp. MEBiC1930]|uniref:DUF4270 family protein n=1 Tax=Seonamhaeicola sp. MEBiC01930 TaxID=2976768 RepID=UPI0032445EC5
MKIFFISIIGLFFMFSCSDELKTYPVGSDFIENNINLKIIDTFSINTGTFKLDSLVTSSTSRILLGSINDAYLGQLTAQTYFQVQNSNFSISDDAVYDSIGLVLNYDKYYYGDTTQVQTYKVHRLLEYFEPQDDGDDFYNVSKLDYEEDILGEVSFVPRPNSANDSIYISLDTHIGEEIFNKIRDNDINTADDFLQYFKGLTVVPDDSKNTHILGFNFESYSDILSNSSMRIFYTEDAGDISEGNDRVLNFIVSSAAKQFNAINSDLEGSYMSNLLNQDTSVSSNDTDQLIFAQGGTGVSAKIEMPTLKDLNTLYDDSTVLNAELSFSPLKNSNNNTNSLQDSLAVYVIDQKNRIVSQLADIDANSVYAILNQNDDEFTQNTYYTVDMSGFVETILSSDYDLNYALMIQFVNYDKTVNRLVIDNYDESNNIKLSVAYLNY